MITILLTGPARLDAKPPRYPELPPARAEDRILIVAPHVDDETIGAAGYAADAIARGADVSVAFLTAGDCNRFSARLLSRRLEPSPDTYLSVGRLRISEARAAMRLLGIRDDRWFMLGYPDRGLRAMLDDRTAVVRSSGTAAKCVPYDEAISPGSPYRFTSLMTDLERVLDITRPTTVVAPVAFDIHSDHSAAAELVDTVTSSLAGTPRRLGYLVHASRLKMSLLKSPERPLEPPARMRSLEWATYPLHSAARTMKDAILRTYRSQGPYTELLRNAFVRSNELFFVNGARTPARP